MYDCRQRKKYKKVKKNLEIRKNRRIFVAVIKKQSNMKTTKESKIDRVIEVSEYVGIAIFSIFMAFGLLF